MAWNTAYYMYYMHNIVYCVFSNSILYYIVDAKAVLYFKL